MRPWSPIPIDYSPEPLSELPPALWRLEPHPYQALGAPYGQLGTPFRLRQGVLQRLLQAEALLLGHGCRLAIFDAWRPVAVQRFMVEQAIAGECLRQGIDPAHPSPQLQQVLAEVGRFWAPPSDDPTTPPPHSTGGAVDLTLAEPGGTPLAMGGEIDAIAAHSEPDHYGDAARLNPAGEAGRWHGRRQLLAAVMGQAGFAQHPNEWWHFSYGDQLWAWRSGQPRAYYGRAAEG